ncbi:hypothetical protein M0R19_00085 [Candidatus Pacearchaeota archaeon]|jgi:hypothetical protein|nr:hypothetical protein [Candidatus Pacearchaeota archaeon]
MSLTENLKEEYLKRCIDSCNDRGYTGLSIDRNSIKEEIMKKYSNGNQEEIKFAKKLIDLFDKEVFSFLDEITTQKHFRIFSWPSLYEPEIRKRINNNLG